MISRGRQVAQQEAQEVTENESQRGGRLELFSLGKRGQSTSDERVHQEAWAKMEISTRITTVIIIAIVVVIIIIMEHHKELARKQSFKRTTIDASLLVGKNRTTVAPAHKIESTKRQSARRLPS